MPCGVSGKSGTNISRTNYISRWYTKEIVPNEHLPIPQSPSFFGEDEAGLIVLPALNNVQCDVDDTKRKSYKVVVINISCSLSIGEVSLYFSIAIVF